MILEECKQSISGINIRVNPNYISNTIYWFYKCPSCSLTKIGNFNLIYINQIYIEENYNIKIGIINLLISLTCMGYLYFGEEYKYNQTYLYNFINTNLNKIVYLSGLSFCFDYNENRYIRENRLSKVETSLRRHNSLVFVYDKRNYVTKSYKSLRNNESLISYPIRMEFNFDLHYSARYLENIEIFNCSIQELIFLFSPYIFKVWKRHQKDNNLPPLPYDFYFPGRVSHSLLREIKQ